LKSGRNDTITQGTRVTTLSYDAAGFLHSVLDPAQHTSVFGYDLAGRPTSETLPDTSVIGMAYDANGNTTSVTPPGRPAHAFVFTSEDLESDYTPPDVGQPRGSAGLVGPGFLHHAGLRRGGLPAQRARSGAAHLCCARRASHR